MISAIVNFDVAICEFFVNNTLPPIVDYFMVFITHLGDAGLIWLLASVVFLCFKKTRLWGICVLLALGFSFLSSQLVLKSLINRPRPFLVVDGVDLLISTPLGSSFPSAHAASSFAAAVSIFYNNKKWGVGFFVLALLIAVSRVYLCVHFLSDVVAGAILGVCIGLCVSYLACIKNDTEVDSL